MTVALYGCIGLIILWPYRHADFRLAGDLNFVLGMVSEGRNALNEGQFPIRVAPRQWERMRFPLFQYYGNLPFTVTGALAVVTGGNPYAAWKIATLLTFLVGGLGAEALAYLLTRHRGASVLAAAVFLLAPYQFTDVNGRGAFSEQVALNLLPAAIFFTYRTLLSTRPKYVLACAVAWTLIGLTHNIAYVYGVLLAGALFLSYLRLDRRSALRLGRLAAAGAIQALLLLWYFVPQLATLKSIVIGRQPIDPYHYSDLSPLYVLLSPKLSATPAAATARGLGLQVGWPILLGAAFAIAAIPLGRSSRFTRAAGARLAVLFALAFFIAWSPFDFWRHLPMTLWFVQFPYRLLMLVTLFGAMLTGIALSAWFPGQLRWRWASIILVLLAISTIPFIPPDDKLWPLFVEHQTTDPYIGATPLDAYLLTPAVAEQSSWLRADSGRVDWQYILESVPAQQNDPGLENGRISVAADKRHVRFGRVVRYDLSARSPTLLEMPVLYYPRVLDVRDNGQSIKYGNVGHYLAVKLQPGSHRVTVRYVGIRWANAVSAAAWGALGVIAAAALGKSLARRWRRQVVGAEISAVIS